MGQHQFSTPEVVPPQPATVQELRQFADLGRQLDVLLTSLQTDSNIKEVDVLQRLGELHMPRLSETECLPAIAACKLMHQLVMVIFDDELSFTLRVSAAHGMIGRSHQFLNEAIDAVPQDPKWSQCFCRTVSACTATEMEHMLLANVCSVAKAVGTPLSVEHELGTTCSICMNPFFAASNEKMEVYCLPCGHVLHKDCGRLWFQRNKTTCPVCRRDVRHASTAMMEPAETIVTTVPVNENGAEKEPQATNDWNSLISKINLIVESSAVLIAEQQTS